MKITVLTDDKVKKRGFLAEHGLSLCIENKDCNILFDTGQSDVFIRNASALQLDLNDIDYIVLSHGHYDHCGGIVYLPELRKNPKIYIQESAFRQKYVVNPDGESFRDIGIQWSESNYNRLNANLSLIKGNVEINSGITLLGRIPSSVEFEEVPKGFYTMNRNEMTQDMFTDEQILVFDTNKGLVVFLGCSHPGVINCLKYVMKQYPDKKIDTLIAGMHLENVDLLRLQLTIQYMLDFNIRRILPLHCTGIYAISEMKRFLKDRCHVLYAGDSIEI